MAVSKDRSDLVVLMIGNGADVNTVSDDRQTALAELLVKAGAER